jgi:hypothetical protein
MLIVLGLTYCIFNTSSLSAMHKSLYYTQSYFIRHGSTATAVRITSLRRFRLGTPFEDDEIASFVVKVNRKLFSDGEVVANLI